MQYVWYMVYMANKYCTKDDGLHTHYSKHACDSENAGMMQKNIDKVFKKN